MSCCRRDEELERQKRTNRIIERQLKIERKARREPIQILLLGDEAKQAELMTLVKANSEEEMAKEQRVLRIPEIVCNIADIVASLSAVLKKQDNAVENTSISEKLDRLSKQLFGPTDVASGALLDLSQLCMDSTIQLRLKSNAENEIPSNAAYFLLPEKLQEIAEPQYVPSDEDIIQCKERFSTIVESTVILQRALFSFYQFPKLPWCSLERTCKQLGITAKVIVYLMDCGGVDEVQEQDTTCTKLTAAINEYEKMGKSEWFSGTSIFVFVLGLHRMVENQTTLDKFYSECSSDSHLAYVGGTDYEKVQHFILEKIMHVRNSERVYYRHFTEVIDTSSVRTLYQCCKAIILSGILRTGSRNK